MGDNYDTLAGKWLGYGEDQFVLVDKKANTQEPVRVNGRRLYCREQRTDEIVGNIVIPDRSRESRFLLVLAIGAKCGQRDFFWKRMKKSEKEVLRNNPGMSMEGLGALGSVLTLEERPAFGLTRSPYNPRDEFFINETELMAYLQKE